MTALLEQNIQAADRSHVGPLLESGLHLSQQEFHRRYELMPNVKKAELVKGLVIMGSPTSKWHSDATLAICGCLAAYCAGTPFAEAGNAGSVILDLKNEFQPDVFLRLHEDCGGQSKPGERYLHGAPEFIVEAAYSSAAYDLHEKLEVYESHNVREYVVWQGEENAMNCFRLENGRFRPATLPSDGIFRSSFFGGLWLDAAALLKKDLKTAIQTIERGLQCPEALAFRAELERRRLGK